MYFKPGPSRGAHAVCEALRVVRLVCFAVCEYTGITLTRYMCEIARANPGLQDLEALISSIQTACKTINSLVQRAHITGLVGYADGGGSINVQGEEQKTLDILTNDVLKKALRFTGKMGVIASEEEDNPVDGTPMRRSSTATRGHRTLLIGCISPEGAPSPNWGSAPFIGSMDHWKG